MITFIGILIAILVGVFLFIRKKREADRTDQELELGDLFKPIGITIVLIIASFFQPIQMERVDAGHIGIKVNLVGDNRGVGRYEYKTGFVFYNSWFSDVLEFPTHQINIKYEAQEVITRGGFPATIAPTFTYATVPTAVGDMFQNLRVPMDQIESGWLHTVVVGSINDVANRWTVDEIFNNREKFEGDISKEVNKRVQKWFIMSQLRTNITPPEALKNSIIAKTKAIQDVQVAEQNKLVKIAEGETNVAMAKTAGEAAIVSARADSASLVISAAGEAEAIRRKQATLSSLYIELIKAEKWNGALPTITSGNSGMMLNVGPIK